MTLAAENSFQTFGLPHVAVMALTAVLAVGVAGWARRAGSGRRVRGVCLVLAGVLVANELLYLAYGLAVAPLEEWARRFLPLHVCGVAIFLTAWTLVKRSQYVYEIAYFWGLGGSLQAVLTPNLVVGFPSYWFFQFFITHCVIVVSVLFATLAMKMRPAPGAVRRVFVVTNLYLAVVAGVNWLLGSNYMFLRAPPRGASPFFFLPWPWYILFLEAAGLGIVWALYLPFAIARRRGARGHQPG